MKKNGFSHIRRWLWLFFIAVMLSSAAVYFLIYNEIYEWLSVLSSIVAATGQDMHGAADVLLAGLRLRLLMLLSAGFIFILILSLLWLKTASHHIHRPITNIQRALNRLAQGKLNETVTIETVDEFGQMAGSLNELAANLQELLLYIWKQTGQCMTTLEKIEAKNAASPDHELPAETVKELELLADSIRSLRQMAKAYVFYDVRLNGDETLAIRHPGNETAAEDVSSR